MHRFLNGFIKDEKGQAMTEYGLVLALVALVVIAAIAAFGKELSAKFTSLKDSILNAGTTPE